MAIKLNPNRKPDKDEIFRFLTDLKKSAYTDLGGMLTLLRMEYPALSKEESKSAFLGWAKENKLLK